MFSSGWICLLLAASSFSTPSDARRTKKRCNKQTPLSTSTCPPNFRNAVFNTGCSKQPGWPGTTWSSLSSNGVSGWIGFTETSISNTAIYQSASGGPATCNSAIDSAQIPICMDPRDVNASQALLTGSNPPSYMELYNEPDFSYEGFTPLTQPGDAATSLAQLLQTKTSTTLIAPALAQPNSDWLTQFDNECGKCVTNSIPIVSMHIYNQDPNSVIASIKQFHNTWPGKRIWITELAPSPDPTGESCTMTSDDIVSWMNNLLPQIVSLGYVDKIFWNSGEAGTLVNTKAPDADHTCDPSLTDANGNPTKILEAYAKMC